MKIIIFMIILFISKLSFAGEITSPPPLSGEPVAEQHYFQEIYDNWNIVGETTAAPNGAIKGKLNQIILYHSNAMEMWVNCDGNLWWQRIN